MPVGFRAMSPSDYLDIGLEVKEAYTKDAYAVLSSGLSSSMIFGQKSSFKSTVKSAMRDNVRAYISLVRPTINQLLARHNASLLMKVLDMYPVMQVIDKNGKEKEEKDLKAGERICRFQDVWSKSRGELIPKSEAESVADILCGAEIFKMKIDEFSIEDAIKKEFAAILAKVTKAKPKGTFNKGGEGLRLAGGWKFKPEDEKYLELQEELSEYLKSEVFVNAETRLTYLLNMTSKDNLYGMLMEHVVVLPIGMRPDIENRHDQFSQAYADIISANNNMRLVVSGVFTVEEYINRYWALDRAVRYLISDLNPNKEKRKPIQEKLKGKEGFIRGKMLGKRVDFSGRSVITIDPFMSIINIGIPKRMAPKLYRHHLLKNLKNPILSDWLGRENDEKCCERLEKSGILDRVPIQTGRQPTLHKLSMQAYWPVLVEGRSIKMNPTAVPAFNADFDGDQMWVRVPISDGAVQETKDLMLTTQNLFLPESGECTITPRQEMVYGLNICTLDSYKKGTSIKSYGSLQEVVDDVLAQEVKVSDTVTCMGQTELAGRLAFKWCLHPYVNITISEIKAKNISNYVMALYEKGTQAFVTGVDRMVLLGFKISALYPPTLSILDDYDTKNLFDEFHDKVRETSEWYMRGFEEESTYSSVFSTSFDKTNGEVKSSIIERIGKENGFARLATSGARGSTGNLTQIYGYKGQPQKSARESFNAVIEHSYIDQLNSLEHFVTAYGGRKGLIDKSLNTSDTGYASRQMWHANQSMVIVKDDCGTKEGLRIDKSDIAMFYNDTAVIDAIFENILSGRYIAYNGIYITREIAKDLCKTQNSVTIRSPLTCSNPCCRKCYGDDLSTNRNAVVGLPVGIIAAHSIGKVGSQLSLDSFKKGGVASKGDIVSSFDKLEAYLNMRRLRKNAKFSTYDPVAWASGPIIVKELSAKEKEIRIEGSQRSVKLPIGAILKQVAVKGEGMCIERGDYDPNELLEISGVEATQKYMIHMLYSIYRDEAEVNMKHFEIILSSMTMAMVINTDRPDLKVGQFHDMVQMKSGSLENTEYYTKIVGMQRVQTYRAMALSTIVMEHLAEGLSRSVLIESEDPLTMPMQRILLGKGTYGGTHYPNYIENRKI